MIRETRVFNVPELMARFGVLADKLESEQKDELVSIVRDLMVSLKIAAAQSKAQGAIEAVSQALRPQRPKPRALEANSNSEVEELLQRAYL